MIKNIISFCLEIGGMVVLTIGYRKSNRNLMLLGAVMMWVGGSMNDMIQGFLAGYKAEVSH